MGGFYGGLSAGLLRGFGSETARQEETRRREDAGQQALAIDFWSNVLSRGDLTPEGRQFVLGNIQQTMGAKPSRGFGGVRRGGKNQFDITQLIGKALEYDQPTLDKGPAAAAGTVRGSQPGLYGGQVPVEGPAAPVKPSRLFSDPEDQFRRELNIRTESGIRGARGEAEAKAGVERQERERIITEIDKMVDIDPQTRTQMKAMVRTGHSLPATRQQPLTDFGKRYASGIEKYTTIGKGEDEAHARTMADIEAEDKAKADEAALDAKLKQALLNNRLDTGDDTLSPSAKMSNMRILRQQAMAQALTAEQNAMFDPRYRALPPQAQAVFLRQIREETYRRAIAPLTPEEIDAAMLNLRDTGNVDALRERGPGDFADLP